MRLGYCTCVHGEFVEFNLLSAHNLWRSMAYLVGRTDGATCAAHNHAYTNARARTLYYTRPGDTGVARFNVFTYYIGIHEYTAHSRAEEVVQC